MNITPSALTLIALTVTSLPNSVYAETSLPQLSAATPSTLTTDCDAFSGQLTLRDTHIDSIETITDGTLRYGEQGVGEHCLVKGRMHQRVSDIDGQSYRIGFEMRLPKQWNGRFLHQGNGGLDGAVRTAEGAFGGGPFTSALLQGFAVISSDAGHSRPLPTFGYDPQARLDYGYQAVEKLTPMAKSLIQQIYGKQPDRSYFAGCSNGGRHAMVAATRFASHYDGILAGAPGYRLPLAAVANIAGAHVYASIPGTDKKDLQTAFTLTERQTVSNAILAQCDVLDGIKDGMVQDVLACQSAFNLARDVPTCDAERTGQCLTTDQKNAITTIFSGVKTQQDQLIYAPFPYDPGISNQDQLVWEYTAPIQRDSGAVAMIFKTPPAPLDQFNIRNFDGDAFVWQANIDSLVEQVQATNARYKESGLSFMSAPTPENMSALMNKGGKIMVYHGTADAIFSVQDSQAWYDALNETHQGQAAEFAQFYPIPAMGHCRGGQATDQFDMLTPLVDWVENGKRPTKIIASARGQGHPIEVNPEISSAWSANRTRPLCPYPSVALYSGQGDSEEAASFYCK